jgi:hypothetical protein
MRRQPERSFFGRVVLAATACGVSAATSGAQSNQAPPTRSVSNSVSEVRLQRENVFDESENAYWLARVANALHIVTRDRVVRRELLIPEGAPYDSAMADETARNLRKLGIFRDVSVDTTRSDSGLVQHVTTHDSWSTQVYVSFKSTGDQITWGAGVTEKNLLGSHIKASFRYTDDPDRSTSQFSASVPRAWRRLGFDGSYEELSDGKTGRFTASSPFTAIMTPQSGTLELLYNDKDVLRFFGGEEVASDTVRRLLTKGTLNAAWATQASRRGFLRLGSSLQVRRDDFGDFGESTIANADRSVFGELGVNVESSTSTFKVIKGYKTLTGDEDIDLSTTVRGELWVAPNAWGYERFGVGPGATIHVGRLVPNGFTLFDLRASSLFTNKGLDSGSVVGKAVLALYPADRHSVIVNLNGGMQKNPYPGEEFDLGLTYGPRGFPAHAFTGDRGFFTVAEYRWVAIPEVFKIFAVGFAGFVDYGGAWYSGSPTRTGTDAGVGLRIGSIRSSSGKGATRIDLVHRFANDVLPGKWLIAIGSGFPFDRQ